MKKKLLSLLMAGAVVAGATVPAYAQTQTYTKNDTETIEADVTVSGTIKNKDGNAPAGKIQVEVPTKLSFTVDQNGNFTAVQYSIKNSGSEAVQVLVGDFTESNPRGGITLKGHGENMDSLDRSNVQLALKGNTGYVDLSAVNTSQQISIINPGASDSIQLLGAAGKDKTASHAVEKNGASEEFNLVFKIKKQP